MSERPMRLTEKYRPHTVADFIGHSKIKAILSKYVKDPYPISFLLSGPPGVGKTAIAQAVADEVGGRQRNLGARQANHVTIEALCEEITIDNQYAWNVFSPGNCNRDGVQYRSRMFFNIIDEVDQVPETVSYLLLNKLDSSQEVPNTVWIFTCNSAAKLEKRFVSRCVHLEFSMYGASSEIVNFLSRVWHAEGGNGDEPDWERLVRERGSNVRDHLNHLEMELLARG
jgi:DNA polymerase III gamma/tau subunit